MSTLVEVFKNAPPTVRRQLLQLMRGDAAERVAAANELADSGHRPAAGVMRERLGSESPDVAEALLLGLENLAPEVARDGALELSKDASEARAKLGRAFLSKARRLLTAGAEATYPPITVDELRARLDLAEAILRGSEKLAHEVARDGALELSKDASEARAQLGRALLSKACRLLTAGAGAQATSPPVTVDELLARLSDRDADVRGEAVEKLAGLADERIVPALFGRLSDPSPNVVKSALDTILKLAPRKMCAAARKVVFSRKGHACPQVGADFLAQVGDAGGTDLLNMVRNAESDVASVAARALIRFQLDESLRRCEDWIRQAECAKRDGAARIVTRLGACEFDEPAASRERRVDRCTGILVPLLQDPADEVRRTALWGLCENRWPQWLNHARRMLTDSSELVRRQALSLIGRCGNETDLTAVLAMFGDPIQLVRARSVAAATSLASDPELVLNRIRQMLADEKPPVREHGLKLIAERGGRADFDLVAKMLTDKDEDVRKEALAAARARAPSRQAWLALARRGLTDSSKVVRHQALSLIGSRDDGTDLPAVLAMFGDPVQLVRERAIKAATSLASDPELVLNRIRQMLADEKPAVREHGLKLIAERAGRADFDLVAKTLTDKNENVRKEALVAVRALAPSRQAWLALARQRLKDKHWKVRNRATRLIGECGEPGDLGLVTAMFTDKDNDVREEALRAAARIAPDRRAEFALALVTDDRENVAKAAISLLMKAKLPGDLIQIALDKLKKAKGESGAALLDLIGKTAPARMREALDRALHSRSEDARAEAARMLPEVAADDRVPILRHLSKDRSGAVRLAALRSLCRLVGGETKDFALSALRDKSWRVRLEALKALAKDDDPLLVDDILPLARDEDEDVRREAIGLLAKFDDLRVLSELVSSLNDVEDKVRELAQRILSGTQGSVPVLTRFSNEFGTEANWERVRSIVDDINRWGSQIGQELFGRPVIVYNYRQGIGRTHRRGSAVEIEVSDTPVTAGHVHGKEIVRGIALHEIGHHLCEGGVFGGRALQGIARSEGVGEIYDFLRDERLERVLRSRRPEWGVYFDRLASYAFAQNVFEVSVEHYAAMIKKAPEDVRLAILRGDLPGRVVPGTAPDGEQKVALQDRDLLAIPGVVPPLGAFAACLRCGFDPRMHPNPKVAEAIALVPANLKDLRLPDVLQVARKIAGVIGGSVQHKSDMERWRERMRAHREAMRALSRMFDRMAETGHLPDWMRRGAPGVRRNTPVIIYRPPSPGHSLGSGRRVLNLGSQQDFDPLKREEILPYEPGGHARLVAAIRRPIRRLRAYLEQLGKQNVEEYASSRGRRVDIARVRKSTFVPSTNLLVFSRDEIAPDAYIGILIDRSRSMEGEKLERAKAFGALVAESAKGLRGIEGHVNAFDHDTFYLLGGFRQNAIASLVSGGGNNDAGALAKAAKLAFRSRKRNKLVVMISDGSPSGCTFESLKNLVAHLTRNCGIVCAQAAVDEMEGIAFPHYVDLSKYSFDEAVARFGNLLTELTRAWR